MGGSLAFNGRLLLPLLLDAAWLDDSGMGAGRGDAGGIRIRAVEPVDEQLLGRRTGRRGRMPGVRRVAAIGAIDSLAISPCTGYRTGFAFAHPPLRIIISVSFGGVVSGSVAPAANAGQGALAADGALGWSRRGARVGNHATPEQKCHRQLEHASISTESVSIWRPRPL